MNHATILRRSKTHRAAAARNAERFERLFIWHMCVRVPNGHLGLFRDGLRGSGAKLMYAEMDGRSDSQLIHFVVHPGFKIDRKSPYFTVVKEEKVRHK